MVKVKRPPPAFLTRKLDDDKLALVKKCLPIFLKDERAANKGSLPPNMDLLKTLMGESMTYTVKRKKKSKTTKKEGEDESGGERRSRAGRRH